MKKLLIVSVILLSSCLAISNVSAETFLNKFEPEIHIMNTYEMSDDEIYNLYNKIIDENYLYNHTSFTIEDYINARNKLKTMYQDSNTKYIMYAYSGYLYYKTIGSGINSGIAIYTDSNKKFGIDFGFNSESIGSQTVYKYNSSSNSFSSSGSQRMFGSQLSIYDMTTLNRDIADLFETNCHSDSMQYYVPVYGNNKYSGDITYNNQVYSINSYLPIDVYDGLNPLSLGPKIYKYNEEIDTSNLAYIKVNYDTTGATYEDYHFSIIKNINEKLNEAYIEKSYEWGICLDTNTCYDNYVSRDYIEYSSDIKMYSKQAPFKFEDSEHGFYDESQELNYYYEYYDVSNISDLIELDIDSTVPFEVTFGYLEDNVDSFVILNLNGYAGLVLYPIVSNYNGDYRFDLQNANISIYQYADDKVVSKYENITEDIYYMSQIEYQDRKRFYQIVNNKITEDSYIKFNSKYFSYQLLNKLDDSITIINPNTGEEEIINSIEDSENLYKISDANSLIDRVSSFLDDMSKPMLAIFDLFKFGYDRLNSTFKTFLIVAFIIILVAALIFKARGD